MQVSCYAFYVCMYLALSIAKLRSIVASLRQHEFAPSLRRALWSDGWRAIAHVASVVVAVAVFLAFPNVSLAYLDKRVLILLNMHVFLVWHGWEDWLCANALCFRCFDARYGAQYETASECGTTTDVDGDPREALVRVNSTSMPASPNDELNREPASSIDITLTR